jgi:hypothetical protein
MSGGHFEYRQYHIEVIADDVEQLIINNGSQELDDYGYRKHNEYSPATIEQFKTALKVLRLAKIYTQRIDWLVSGDDGEDAFHRRLVDELSKVAL